MDSQEGADPLHYSSEVADALTTLLTVWWSPRFQRDIVGAHGKDLSTIEVRVLWTLGSQGPQRGADLAEALSASAPSVSKAAAKLHDAGLVERVRGAGDQRSHVLALSEAGTQLAQRLFDVGDDMVAEIFAGWDPDEVTRFAASMARFTADSQAYARRIRHE